MTTIADIKKLYSGKGFTTLYTYLRFWEYPRLVRIETLLPKQGKIIDLGSGLGIFSNYVAAKSPKRQVLAIEFDKGKTELAKNAAKKGKIKNIIFDNKDITKVSMQNADAIIIMHVFHHLKSFKDQETLLVECVKKLKKGGLLIIDEVDKNYSIQYFLALITDNLLYLGDKFYFRSKDDMINLLNKLDLTVEVKNVSPIIMPYPELVYVCKKK